MLVPNPKIEERLARCIGFEWDAGNINKNWISHGVTVTESEEVFISSRVQLFDDEGHSEVESRHAILGRTKGNRLLTIVFTIRNNRIRVISARDMSRSDKRLYGDS